MIAPQSPIIADRHHKTRSPSAKAHATPVSVATTAARRHVFENESRILRLANSTRILRDGQKFRHPPHRPENASRPMPNSLAKRESAPALTSPAMTNALPARLRHAPAARRNSDDPSRRGADSPRSLRAGALRDRRAKAASAPHAVASRAAPHSAPCRGVCTTKISVGARLHNQLPATASAFATRVREPVCAAERALHRRPQPVVSRRDAIRTRARAAAAPAIRRYSCRNQRVQDIYSSLA